MTFGIDCQPSYICLRVSVGHHLSPRWQWNTAQPIVLQKQPQPGPVVMGGSVQDVVLCSLGDLVVLCTLDSLWGSGEATAIKAMRELFLGTVLETRSASVASPERLNKHHALGKIIITWMKKKEKKYSSMYFCSQLLFVNPLLSKLGVAGPSYAHLIQPKERNSESECLLGCSCSPTVLAKFAL